MCLTEFSANAPVGSYNQYNPTFLPSIWLKEQIAEWQSIIKMQQSEIIYLKYQNLEDMLKVIIYSSQSMLGVVPMLYYINYSGKHVLFIQTGTVGAATVHYVVQTDKPARKFIQLKRLSGEFTYTDTIGSDAQSLYVPVLNLDKTTLSFPF